MSSVYITAEGAQAMQEEVDFLWEQERPRVVRGVTNAAAEGDRSENAEYIYGKKRLREIDKRLEYLGKRMKNWIVVDVSQVKTDRVYFGCHVDCEDEDGNEVSYQIVGPDEFDHAKNQISMDSPVGKALLGKQVDDEVTIKRPKGTVVYVILRIYAG